MNIHLTRLCNFRCRYCYAVFSESDSAQIPQAALLEILESIAREAQFSEGQATKVNFAGGEPLLYPGLLDAVKSAKSLGLRTSIVTNGSRLEPELIQKFSGVLDILALSVDSMAAATNREIGRHDRKCSPGLDFYRVLASRTHAAGVRLKINTVVNRLNLRETLGPQISALHPFRWKILQAKKILGQNDAQFDAIAVTASEFQEYVLRNSREVQPGIAVVPETSDDMTASYAMIAPNGCFFDNTNGRYDYSQPILEVGIRAAFHQVQFNLIKFAERGGVYA
ncbi:MAG TPA: viperin family antiviral radical SAM protein [Clostridia bacterium]|nr:viperin family antiviral radical SAM protein [Clostridia bacterium]